jgi:hypothetical protein
MAQVKTVEVENTIRFIQAATGAIWTSYAEERKQLQWEKEVRERIQKQIEDGNKNEKCRLSNE